MEKKRYGLIIKKSKAVGSLSKVASIFGDDSSEDDEEEAKKAVNESINQEAVKKKQMKQTQVDVQKALNDDPTVYEYDKVYDELERKKIDSKVFDKDKKSKYIANILKTAALRKREEERRQERKIQKEREAEGDEFEDKESFVTSAYRQKMIDQAEEEERLKRQDAVDAATDATKQKDMSNFYRHLLDRNVSMGGSYSAPVQNISKDDKAKEEKTKCVSDANSKEDLEFDHSGKHINKSTAVKSKPAAQQIIKAPERGQEACRHSSECESDSKRRIRNKKEIKEIREVKEVKECISNEKTNKDKKHSQRDKKREGKHSQRDKKRKGKHSQRDIVGSESDSGMEKDKSNAKKKKRKSRNPEKKTQTQIDTSDSELDNAERPKLKDRNRKRKSEERTKSERGKEKLHESESCSSDERDTQMKVKKEHESSCDDNDKNKKKSREKTRSKHKPYSSDSEIDACEKSGQLPNREQRKSKEIKKHTRQKHDRKQENESSQSDNETTETRRLKPIKRRYSTASSSSDNEELTRSLTKYSKRVEITRYVNTSQVSTKNRHRSDRHCDLDDRHQSRHPPTSSSSESEIELSKSGLKSVSREDKKKAIKIYQTSLNEESSRRHDHNQGHAHDHRRHKEHKKSHKRKGGSDEEIHKRKGGSDEEIHKRKGGSDEEIVIGPVKEEKDHKKKIKLSGKKDNERTRSHKESPEKKRFDEVVQVANDKVRKGDKDKSIKLQPFSKRNDDASLMSAKERYLARKKLHETRRIVHKDDSD